MWMEGVCSFLKLEWRRMVKDHLISSRIKVHYDILWILRKEALQNASFFMVDGVSRLDISKSNTPKDAGDDRDADWPFSSTGVSEVFFVDANGFQVDLLPAVFTPDLWDDHDFLWGTRGLGPVGFVSSNVIYCLWSRNEDVVWNATSCRVSLFIFLQHHAYCGRSRRPDLRWSSRWEQISHRRLRAGLFYYQVFSILVLRPDWLLLEARGVRFCLSMLLMASSVTYLFSKKLTTSFFHEPAGRVFYLCFPHWDVHPAQRMQSCSLKMERSRGRAFVHNSSNAG